MSAEHGRRYRGLALCISFFFCLAGPLPAADGGDAPSDGALLNEILRQAHALGLDEDPYWRILLHYRPHAFGVESFIDDPRFFLAPDGKTNPRAELDATIRAFLTAREGGESSVACRFAARFEWLRERLAIDPALVASAPCTAFTDFMDTVRPASVTLVFPMAHLNSPASMFGHTLLTIETANRSRLLAHAVTYSAFSRDTMGALFALKGLFGLYPGYFSVLPYYKKLQQYSDVDHRDIWEYPLNLTGEEIRRMMLHIRELDSIASDYYFFDENCSYLLFSLLEAARPGVELTGKVRGWLIPLDSIRMIQDQGLITGSIYRPSRTTKIHFLASRISPESGDLALALARGESRGNAPAEGAGRARERRETYDLAGEYLQYLYTSKLVDEKVFQQRFLDILDARSSMGAPGEDWASAIPVPVNPVNGHRSNRVSLGFGLRRNEGFEEVRIRPAYHDLMDSDDGYVEGAKLIFAEVALRYSNTRQEAFLERLDLIDILSLTPRDRFFRPVSWKVTTGLTRLPGEGDKDRLVYQLNPGGGFTFRSAWAGLVYAMLETGVNAGGSLEHGCNAGIGGSAGVVKTFTRAFKAHLSLRGMSYGLGDRFGDVRARSQATFTISPFQAVSFEAERRRTDGRFLTELGTHWNLFF